MADEKEKSGGFVKAILSSVLGLLGGAVLMYVSPLVNNAIKPPRPVPNFSFHLDGPTATFNNRSTGGTQGWWDFGDGSALEPFSPNQGAITHRFPSAGTYSVKLSLHNLIGEEAERTVSINVPANASPPTIEGLTVTPISPRQGRNTAPATFRVVAKLKNADLLIWDIDDQPLEMVTESGLESVEHHVTFTTYGPKNIRLMAVSGKHRVEKAADVWVDVPDDDPMIYVQQTSYTCQPRTMPISVSFPPQFNGAVYPFEVVRQVSPESTIVEATLESPNEQLVRDVRLVIAADKKSFRVSGELMRHNAAGNVPASWFGKVDLRIAKMSSIGSKRCDPISATLQLPGRTLVTLPPETGGVHGGTEWELRQGMDVVYRDTKAPVTQVVRFKDKSYRVTVTPLGNQMQVDAVEATTLPIFSTSSPRK